MSDCKHFVSDSNGRPRKNARCKLCDVEYEFHPRPSVPSKLKWCEKCRKLTVFQGEVSKRRKSSGELRRRPIRYKWRKCLSCKAKREALGRPEPLLRPVKKVAMSECWRCGNRRRLSRFYSNLCTKKCHEEWMQVVSDADFSVTWSWCSPSDAIRWIDSITRKAQFLRRRHPGEDVASADELREILLSQVEDGWPVCKYTGRRLGPDDAHLDHKSPVSKGGSGLPVNLHFLHESVNKMKSDLLHQEFIMICKAIARRNP